MKKPTIEEVTVFCRERGNCVDPEQFWYFYESKGWKIGKCAMKSWQACVHTWERNTTHKMAIQGRDEAVRSQKQALHTNPLPKPKPNPEIKELVAEQYALTKSLRGSSASQRIGINIKIRAIAKEIKQLRDSEMRIKL